jgi:hypothetical protein
MEKLRQFLAEFLRKKDVQKTSNYLHYVALHGRARALYEVGKDDGLAMHPRPFDDSFGGEMQYPSVIGYCLVRFWVSPTLKTARSARLMQRCDNCEKYFIAKTTRTQRFCGDTCRQAWHNRRRIESGEAKEYKRKKRREGAKESYYG